MIALLSKVSLLLSQKVTKAKANFIGITPAHHVPDGANVAQAPSALRVTFGTLVTRYIDLLYKRGNTSNIGNRQRSNVNYVTRNVTPMFPFMFPREVRNKMVRR